jgi:hypothetical protein
MELQKLIQECNTLKVDYNAEFEADLGVCQVELNKYMIYLESIKPKIKVEVEKVDCTYCGKKYADTGCQIHPNLCRKSSY